MASRRSRPRRFLLPTILAAVLAAEVTGLALARTLTAPAIIAPAVAPAAVAAAGPTVGLDRPASVPDRLTVGDAVRDAAGTSSVGQRTRSRDLVVRPLPVDVASRVHVSREIDPADDGVVDRREPFVGWEPDKRQLSRHEPGLDPVTRDQQGHPVVSV